jgi:hypothetical protein
VKAQTERPFIFIIGFNKTATTAIHHLFEDNGFPSVHWDRGRLAKTMIVNCLENRKIFSGYDKKYRVFSDMAVRTRRIFFEANSLFSVMEQDYPGSYFIYNKRNIDDWAESRAAHGNEIGGESLLDFGLRRLGTRDPSVVRDHWKKLRLDFEGEIRRYFKGSDHFLEIDIAAPGFVRSISDFLHIELNDRYWVAYNKRPPNRKLLPRQL